MDRLFDWSVNGGAGDFVMKQVLHSSGDSVSYHEWNGGRKGGNDSFPINE